MFIIWFFIFILLPLFPILNIMNKLYLVILVVLSSCSNKPNIHIGHYHQIEQDGLYHTVNITDSSVFIDEFTIGGEYLFKYSYDTLCVGATCIIKNSDNKVIDFYNPDSWMKVERTKEDFIADLSSSLFLEYIPDTTEKINENIGSDIFLMPIFIGKPKMVFSHKFNDPNLMSKDGYYIQFGDMIMTKDDIEYAFLPPIDSYKLFIHADKETPTQLINELLEIWKYFAPDSPAYIAKMNLENLEIICIPM